MRFSSKKAYFYRRAGEIKEIGSGAVVSQWIAQGKFQAGDEIFEVKDKAEIRQESVLTVNPAGKEE